MGEIQRREHEKYSHLCLLPFLTSTNEIQRVIYLIEKCDFYIWRQNEHKKYKRFR